MLNHMKKKLATVLLLALTVMMYLPSNGVHAATNPELKNVHLYKETFNPQEEWETIYWDLANSSATLSVEIYNPNDGSTKPIRTLMYPTFKNPGSFNVSWDGKYNGQYVDAGVYTYKITAVTDDGGRDQKTGNITVSYTKVGHAPVIGQVAGNDNNDYATPNPFDPRTQSTIINYQVNNYGATTTVNIEIYDNPATTGTPIKTLTSQDLISAIWNGRYENGEMAIQGTYYYKIIATSEFGQDTEVGSVEIKYASTPVVPVPTITNLSVSKAQFDPHTQTVTVSYSVDRTSYTRLEVLSGNAVQKTLQYSVLTNGGSFLWDGTNEAGTMLSEGNYTVRLKACNEKNICSQETKAVEIKYEANPVDEAPVVSNLYASRNPFDPHTQTTTLNYTLNKQATVTAKVLDGNTLVRTLLTNATRAQGNNSLVWNGRNSNGVIVNEGTYTYQVTACNAENVCDQNSSTVEVKYETNPVDETPVLSNVYASPNPFDPHKETTHLNYTLDRQANVTVRVLNGNTIVKTLLTNAERSQGNNLVTWNGRNSSGVMLNEGVYTLEVQACNNNNECNVENTSVTVDYDTNNGGGDDNYNNLLDDVEVHNDVFNPNLNERSQLCFEVTEDGTRVTVDVMDGNNLVERLLNNRLYNEGSYCTYWDGKYSDGTARKDAVYQYRLRAEKDDKVDVEFAYTELDTDGVIIGYPVEDGNTCAGFVDIPADSPFCKAINLMRYREVFVGYPDGTFKPYADINRAETVKVVLLALGKDILPADGTDAGFWDVDRYAWYMPYLRTAKRDNVIDGYPDRSFRPNSTINRVELLKVFLEATGINVPHCNVQPYKDTPLTSETRWYMDYACFAKAYGLMRTDSEGNFNPDKPMTRADVADLFYQFEKRGLYDGVNWTYYNSYYNYYNPFTYNSTRYPVYYY